MQRTEVIVVGLGAMGSATCFQLAARGVPVIGIDQYPPPHPWGSTHGETRITRLAIGEGREYVPLVRRSHEIWPQLGEGLITRAGFLVIGDRSGGFLRQTREVAHEHEIEHEDLDADELRARFPMWAVGERTEAFYEPGAGYLRPELAVSTQLSLARSHGASLRLGERVLGWEAPAAGGVRVRTGSDLYEADQLVLCAGAWIGDLFPEGRDLFAIYRQLIIWFPIREGYPQLRDMPTYVVDLGGEPGEFTHLHCIYGFPAIDGPDGGVKLGAETYEQTVQPDGRQHPATTAEAARVYENCVAPHLPWLGREPVRSASCLYTCTRDSRFLIDRHPEHEAVLIVSPCSGHGFKHSPAIGEAVAQWVSGHHPDIDLSAFSLAQALRT
ncbi:MAG TPA: N-methyl-L-tryptophan oxidase [Solirubrobacteraceae bacterium]|nr:N-methyl-L-tryptophan oxidase [Solirubrobacteraceae bacterium]